MSSAAKSGVNFKPLKSWLAGLCKLRAIFMVSRENYHAILACHWGDLGGVGNFLPTQKPTVYKPRARGFIRVCNKLPTLRRIRGNSAQ